MKITKQQATFLSDLTYSLEAKYGIKIGLLDPHLHTSSIEGANFILCISEKEGIENEENEEDVEYLEEDQLDFQFIHKDDVTNFSFNNPQPKHDDKVKEFIDKINNDIMNGDLGFDPGVTREIDGVMYTVTKRIIQRFDNLEVFETNVHASNGLIHTYGQIEQYSKMHPHFATLKGIVDNVWPDAKDNYEKIARIKISNQSEINELTEEEFEEEPKEESKKSKLITLVSSLIRHLFGR